MNRKRIIQAAVVCVLLLLLGAYMEYSDHSVDDKNQIIRGSPGSGSRQVELTLDAGDQLKDYAYEVVVPAEVVDEATAGMYFTQAEKEIGETFFAAGEHAEQVMTKVHMKTTYAKGMVKAEWMLDSYEAVNVEGEVQSEKLKKEGELVQATAELTCGKYREAYTFSFRVVLRTLSKKEAILKEIRAALEEQGAQEGNTYLKLPDSAAGVTLQWREKKQHLVGKIFFFEVLVLFLLFGVLIERKRLADAAKKEQMKLDYAEVVSKLLVLLGAGMSLKQAWNGIAAQYMEKRNKKETKERWIYEEMVLTNHEMLDGESERRAYQKFGERVDLGVYQRLIRILLQNLQNGSRGLCSLLEQETYAALEERKAIARKLGEEAGTRMLLPLILMLGIVIAIILVPAMLSFQM